MPVRLILIALLAYGAYVIFRRVWPRLKHHPQFRQMLSGIGIRVLLIMLLRRAWPILIGALRSLRFFR